MKIIDVQQRSPEWYSLHQHRITSSRFSRVLNGTPKGWRSLAAEMRGDQTPRDLSHVPALAWGVKYEPAARAMFELKFPYVTVREVGFVMSDCGDYGVSPDGLTRKGTLEIKCPFNPDVHEHTLRYEIVPSEYMPQVQGQLWITGKTVCYFISFDPRQPDHRKLVVVRVKRDEEYIKLLDQRCREFMHLYKQQIDPEQFYANSKRKLF